MTFKLKLFLFIFSIILLLSLVILWFNTEKKEYQPGLSSEDDKAVNQAQLLFSQIKETNTDLSKGPCLTNALMPSWVADLAHNPREPVDNLPENQCKAFIEGSAKHFVELDLNGNVIKVR